MPCEEFHPQLYRSDKCKVCFFTEREHMEKIIVGVSEQTSDPPSPRVTPRHPDEIHPNAEKITTHLPAEEKNETEAQTEIPQSTELTKQSNSPESTDEWIRENTATNVNTEKLPVLKRGRQTSEPRPGLKKMEPTKDLKPGKQEKERSKEKKKSKKKRKSKHKLVEGIIDSRHTRSASSPDTEKAERIDQTIANWYGKEVIEPEKKKPLSLLTRRIGKTTDPTRKKSAHGHLKDSQKASSLPKVLAYPIRQSPRKETEGTRFKQEILDYLRISVIGYSCSLPEGSIVEEDGLGLRFNMEDSAAAPLILPAREGKFPPSQWVIPLSRDKVAKKPDLEIIVQDFAADIVVGNVIIPLTSIPHVHPSMTYGIVRVYSWNPYWNINGKIRLGIKLTRATRRRSLTGCWSEETCGGDLTCISWPKSPQYYFRLVQQSTCAITLCSSLGAQNEIGFYVLMIGNETEEPSMRLDNTRLGTIQRNFSVFKNALRVEAELKLSEGHYIILPCTKRPRVMGDFQLTIGTTDGTPVVKFSEIVAASNEVEASNESSSSEEQFMDGLDVELGSNAALSLQLEEPEDLDDLDWDMDLGDTPITTRIHEVTGDTDDFGDDFGDDLGDIDLSDINQKKQDANEESDPFEEGFDDFGDLDIPKKDENIGNQAKIESFDDDFGDIDFAKIGKSSGKENDGKNDGDFGDDFDFDDFDAPLEPNQSVRKESFDDDFGDVDFASKLSNVSATNDDFEDGFGDVDLSKTIIDDKRELPELPNPKAAINLFQLIEERNTAEIESILPNNTFMLDDRDENGDTPLLKAIKGGSSEITRVLLLHNANVDQANTLTKLTPIIAALRQGLVDCVKLLAAQNCNASLKEISGDSGYSISLSLGKREYYDALALCFHPNRTIVQKQWELTSLYVEESDVNPASVRVGELLEVLEIVGPIDTNFCVFQLILYNSCIFTSSLFLHANDIDVPYEVLLAGFRENIMLQIENEEISSNFVIVEDLKKTNVFLFTKKEIEKWDRSELKEFGLLCHLLEYEGGTKFHAILDYINYMEHTVTDLRKPQETTTQKFYRLHGLFSHWKASATQVLRPVGEARLAFSLTEFRNLKKDIKSDLYFIVGINAQQAKSNPRKYRETQIGLHDIWLIDSNCNELYIVLYSKDKNVNAKPLGQIRLPIEEIRKEKRIKKWISLDGVAEVYFSCCFSACLVASSSSMRHVELLSQ